MRIGCLQFAPEVGDVDNNLHRADDILNKADPKDLDLLVLPELAFSGYNFKTLRDIYPFLEPTGSGISSVWARTTALKYECAVAVGYPETADVSHRWPTSPEYYNSLIMVNQDGDAWALYRKSHLYYTDESWALEGPDGFWKGYLPGVGKLAMGICMDINPYRFEAPWNDFEFATHALKVAANVVIVSMAWLTHENRESFLSEPAEPDMDTLTYWVQRMEPLIRCENEEEVVVIFANRSGFEDEVLYAGTSAVIGIRNGEVTVYGLLGRGDNDLLVVDTSQPGMGKLVYRPEGVAEAQTADGVRLQHDDHVDSQPVFEAYCSTDNSTMNTPPDSGKAGPGRTVDADRRAADHTFIPPDMATPEEEISSGHDLENSPISTPHFWIAAEQLVQGTHDTPPLDTNDAYRQWRTSLADSNDDDDDDDGGDYSSLGGDLSRGQSSAGMKEEPSVEFSSLIQGLLTSDAAQDVSLARPFSTKSRNATRPFTSHNGSQATKHRDAAGDLNVLCGDSPAGTHFSSQKSNAGIGLPAHKTPSVTSSHCVVAALPDLEGLGADIIVFEEEQTIRQKRDSLVCHVDHDDFVVLQTARKDGLARQKKDEFPRLTKASRESQSGCGQRHRQGKHGRGGVLPQDPADSAHTYQDHIPRSPPVACEMKPSGKSNGSLSSKTLETMSSQSRDSLGLPCFSPQQSYGLPGRDFVEDQHYEFSPSTREQILAFGAALNAPPPKHRARSFAKTSEKSSPTHIVLSHRSLENTSNINKSSISQRTTPRTRSRFTDTHTETVPPTPIAMALGERYLDAAIDASTFDQEMHGMALHSELESKNLARQQPQSAA